MIPVTGSRQAADPLDVLRDGQWIYLTWAFYPDKEAYTGTTLTGQEGVANLSFPGILPDAARLPA